MPKRLNNNRVYPEGTSPRPDLSKVKRAEAVERQTYYDGLSIDQKITALDTKLGVGVGAKKQRARFADLLEKKNAPIVAPVVQEEHAEKKHMKAKERRHKEKKD